MSHVNAVFELSVLAFAAVSCGSSSASIWPFRFPHHLLLIMHHLGNYT
jgi:hypothetical protein